MNSGLNAVFLATRMIYQVAVIPVRMLGNLAIFVSCFMQLCPNMLRVSNRTHGFAYLLRLFQWS